jgi:hypothetical protein
MSYNVVQCMRIIKLKGFNMLSLFILFYFGHLFYEPESHIKAEIQFVRFLGKENFSDFVLSAENQRYIDRINERISGDSE